MKKYLLTIAALFLALAAGPGLAAQYTLTLATWGASSHPQVKIFAKRFMELAEKNSNGQIKFKYFPDDVMVKEAFVPNAVPDGTVDISLTTIDSWAGRIADVSLTTTPLWSLSMEDTRKKLLPGNPIFEYFNSEFEKNGTRILCLFDIGPAIISTNFSLMMPQDMKGKVIRGVSKGSAEVLQTLGASPVVLSIGDVYAALQRGTVDGAMSGLQGAVGLKHYEVTKYAFATNDLMGTFIHGYVMNLKKFNSLPKSLQDVLIAAATEARTEAQDNLIASYGDYLKVEEQHGVKVFIPQKGTPAWSQWNAALASFKEASKKRYPAALVNLVAQ